MYLSRLYIENYRSIQKTDLKFEPGKNVIVGRNNSGKSNILKAIDLILGEYSPTYNKSENITDNDFFQSNISAPIFIWAEIQREGLSDGSLEKIDFTEVCKTAYSRVFANREHTQPHRIRIDNFGRNEKFGIFEFTTDKGQARFDSGEFYKKWIGGKAYCKGWTFEKEFSDKSNFALAFLAYRTNDELKKELVFLYRETLNEDWIVGLGCNLRNSIIQSAIIPAFRDPKDQLRINSYTWFGKLLKAYIKTDSKALSDAFLSVKSASDELFKDLKNTISEKEIDVAFPNTTISFQFNPNTKQDIHKSTLIYVNDGFNSELKEKGAGIQSAVIISLYDFYVRNIAHSGSSLLAVEEPELYLHPHGRRVISDRLSRFVSTGKNQVIITTHTAEFLSNIYETQNIICVRKSDAATTAKNIYFNTPKRKQILIKKQNAELFFADSVILTEGADKYFIEEAARCFANNRLFCTDGGEPIKLSENWLNDHNVSIINCGGKNELWKYAEILTELDIKFIATADFDFLRAGLNEYFHNLNFEQSQADRLNALKSKIASVCPKGQYKSLEQFEDDDFKKEILSYLNSLETFNIYIFTGELEHFYKKKPVFDKEAGVIETLGALIEQNKPLEDFIMLDEYFLMFSNFISLTQGLTVYEECNVATSVSAGSQIQ
jgi:putative ATP-dependent endonuclease of OLD family